MSNIVSVRALLFAALPLLALAACNSAIVGPQDAIERAGLPPASSAPAKGDILIVGGGTGSASSGKSTVVAEFYHPASGKFALTGSLGTSRAGIPGVVFSSGPDGNDALVEGGLTGTYSIHNRGEVSVSGGETSTSELYNSKSGKFSATGKMTTPRSFHTATPLDDGTVLITGGFDPFGNPIAAAELFNPKTGKYTAISDMTSPRALHTATLLDDGTVLIVGGIFDDNGTTTGTTELYDPDSQSFTALSPLPNNLSLAAHTATLIANCKCKGDGDVLIAGGDEGFGVETSTTTLVFYNPNDQTFAMAKSQLVDDRAGHTATLLSDGTVLIAGGSHGQAGFTQMNQFGIVGGVRDSAEIFDPSSGRSTCVGGKTGSACNTSMVNSRMGHTATLITAGSAAGEVLLAGGAGATTATKRGQGAPLDTAELYSPHSGKFVKTGAMNAAHVFGAAAAIP